MTLFVLICLYCFSLFLQLISVSVLLVSHIMQGSRKSVLGLLNWKKEAIDSLKRKIAISAKRLVAALSSRLNWVRLSAVFLWSSTIIAISYLKPAILTKTPAILSMVSNSPNWSGLYMRASITIAPKLIAWAMNEPLKSTLAFFKKSVFNNFRTAK